MSGTVCEDAPCCGCCGPAVWRADAIAADEARFDDFDYPTDAQIRAEIEAEDFIENAIEDGTCCSLGDRRGDSEIEADAFGFRVSLTSWSCDHCGTPDPTRGVSRWDFGLPSWADRFAPSYRTLYRPLRALHSGAWKF